MRDHQVATYDEAATVGPRCGNNPNVRLTPGDRQAIDDFKAYLAARREGMPATPDGMVDPEWAAPHTMLGAAELEEKLEINAPRLTGADFAEAEEIEEPGWQEAEEYPEDQPCTATFREEPMPDRVFCGERGYHQRHTSGGGSEYYAWLDGDEGAGWDR